MGQANLRKYYGKVKFKKKGEDSERRGGDQKKGLKTETQALSLGSIYVAYTRGRALVLM